MGAFAAFLMCISFVHGSEERIEVLDLDVIQYEDLVGKTPSQMEVMKRALHEKGIVAVKGIPGYAKKARAFIEEARSFAVLSDPEKQKCSPDRSNPSQDTTIGYEIGVEKFKRPDGSWMIDDSKSSYYAYVPDRPVNLWPEEGSLKTAYLDIANLMFEMANKVLEAADIIGNGTIPLDSLFSRGRMLHYLKQSDETMTNPYWCGAHFDHGIFTALLPAYYYAEGVQVSEPEEAGLFVRKDANDVYKKVVANDLELMLFQVGEFAQLASDDAIRATEHRVHKAKGGIERFTMALFLNALEDLTITSRSVLTSDSRYGGKAGEPCTYGAWEKATLDRYRVKKEEKEQE